MTTTENGTITVAEYLNKSKNVRGIKVSNNTISITTTRNPVLEAGYAQRTYNGDISDVELSTQMPSISKRDQSEHLPKHSSIRDNKLTANILSL